jgi:hypothetical protein
MSDVVKPLKLETPPGGTEVDKYPTEVNPSEDSVLAHGIAIEDENTTIKKSTQTGVDDMELTSPDAGSVLLKDIAESSTGVPMYVAQNGYKGSASAGKYLEFFSGVPSSSTPFVPPEDATITALSVSVKSATTVTFELDINGVNTETLTLTAADSGYKIDLSHYVYAGDDISVWIQSGSARDILFNIFMQPVIL